MQIVKKISKITFNVIFYFIILIFLLFSIANITAQDKHDIPNIFGYGIASVRTGSMDGDEKTSFPAGSLVIVKVGTPKIDSLTEEKDILVFLGRVQGETDFIIHRLKAVHGDTFLTTKGDANEFADPMVRIDQVKGVYVSHIPVVGGVFLFLRTPMGFAVGVLLPLLIFLLVQLVMVIRIWNQRSKVKFASQYEVDKEKIRRELEAELLAKIKEENSGDRL